MNSLLVVGMGIAAALSYFCYDRLAEPWNFIAPPVLLAATVIALTERRRGIRIGGMNWTEAELCQHFFISGATGSSCQFGNYLRMKAMETRLRARRAPFGLPAEGALGSGQEPTSEQRCTFTTPSSNTPLRPALNVSLYSPQNSA